MTSNRRSPRLAGVFDIRILIGGLLGLYGVILIVMGMWFTDPADQAKVGGVNLNLEVGLGVAVVAGLMIGWALLRPVRLHLPS